MSDETPKTRSRAIRTKKIKNFKPRKSISQKTDRSRLGLTGRGEAAGSFGTCGAIPPHRFSFFFSGLTGLGGIGSGTFADGANGSGGIRGSGFSEGAVSWGSA
ncbi:MAG TPA: hypothetical protein PLL75_07560, partial [Candidatus Omnitrophota bacterium]|nr:hypothetical protein [Candidatus Omnitrophota bacterium]